MTPSSQDGPPLRHRSLPESVHEIRRARILNNEIPAGAVVAAPGHPSEAAEA